MGVGVPFRRCANINKKAGAKRCALRPHFLLQCNQTISRVLYARTICLRRASPRRLMAKGQGHLRSRAGCARVFKHRFIRVLLLAGFTWTRKVASAPVSSYLTFPSLPLASAKTADWNGGLFLLHFPWGCPRLPLAAAIPCEARTFLTALAGGAALRFACGIQYSTFGTFLLYPGALC